MMGTQPMEMRPPYTRCQMFSIVIATMITYDVVVLAADGAGLARVLASADTRDAGALEANLASDVSGTEAQ